MTERAVITPLLPPAVVFAEEPGDPPYPDLSAEEFAQVAGAVPERRREFATVRLCARRALAQLGLPALPLLPGPGGAPRWPAGVVGSMTHCPGYRAAAIARRRDVVALGIDAEPAEPLAGGLLEAIALPGERAHVRRLSRSRPSIAWDRLLFSAKEAVYKSTFPATGVRLGFEDAAITFDPVDGSFRARLVVPGLLVDGKPRVVLAGRWTAARGLLLTAIALPAAGRAPPGDRP
ncbi:4'-phosphopantetheinyl transferase superfamily protein [Streptomyces phaeolivaceus]|uniref:4'-phosphopantetheinyl transferase superfamily protein n=1 Tax=Streptomyces phaeolivaceus TaxID=2653200 RepID=A0A5P8K440_9ACTN|nr:4'-phosphopantetheinyl transferase superfamily protein [Streptomyces phaeolivaceus]QFQ97780.1 4'-phosphopantetheinyl transferase superfamily protein [Streptomyces phaeolivaceus]